MNTVRPGKETTEYALTQQAVAAASRMNLVGILLIIAAVALEVLQAFVDAGVGGHVASGVAGALGALLKMSGTTNVTQAVAAYSAARGMAKTGADEVGSARLLELQAAGTPPLDPPGASPAR